MNKINPFGQIRASDYTDDQINSLWVEFGAAAIDAIIEPRSKISKFILGGKGSGKTHLLRYHSYPVARLRFDSKSGLAILAEQQFLAVFLRAAGVDSARFESAAETTGKWQQLFGIFLELRLAEEVVEALYDIKTSSVGEVFNDRGFIEEIADIISNESVLQCNTIEEFIKWIVAERRNIDEAINNAAFSGNLNIRIPFSLSSLALGIGSAFETLHKSLKNIPLIYLIDEIENFSESQQQVVNSLIRYGGGVSTFRVTGRLYAIKTHSTIASGERNIEDSEFKITYLDDKLRNFPGYPKFAREFVTKHLWSAKELDFGMKEAIKNFDPRFCFEEISPDNFYGEYIRQLSFDREPSFLAMFISVLKTSQDLKNFDVSAEEISQKLTDGFPLLLQKLNILLFCKKFSRRVTASKLLADIVFHAKEFLEETGAKKGFYSVAYGHYAADLFAQLCRESKNSVNVPYAGFETFVKMSAGNPRNLLIILGRAYDAASFKEVDFIHNGNLSTTLQTSSVMEAALFAYKKDSGSGRLAEEARMSAGRLAALLRTARYSLNIPEVSPLAVSFSEEDLSKSSRDNFECAMHNSFIFEIKSGRPDRNSQKIHKKIQLNTMLAPRWGLPLGRRGDLTLNARVVNAIFDPDAQDEFDIILKELNRKWNSPFKLNSTVRVQKELF